MGLAGALVLLASLQSAGEATPVVLPREPGPTLILAEVTRPARYIGMPQSCVEPDESGEVPICFMELYEADIIVLRHWSGPAVPRRVTVRFTAHSFHAVWRRGTRFVLALQPFEDAGRAGLFAGYWDWEDADGLFCENPQTIERMEPPLASIYLRGRLRMIPHDTDEWSAGMIRCATGRERVR